MDEKIATIAKGRGRVEKRGKKWEVKEEQKFF